MGSLCTVVWRGVRYRVECTPSHLLSLATKVAEEKDYFEVYRLIVESLHYDYRLVKNVVEVVLSEK